MKFLAKLSVWVSAKSMQKIIRDQIKVTYSKRGQSKTKQTIVFFILFKKKQIIWRQTSESKKFLPYIRMRQTKNPNATCSRFLPFRFEAKKNVWSPLYIDKSTTFSIPLKNGIVFFGLFITFLTQNRSIAGLLPILFSTRNFYSWSLFTF